MLQDLKEVSVLKIRIKFTKTGPVRYIGHLDVMRYFQKLNRRAGLDVKYTTGFSPHQIMSFAAPLGVGLESFGEYVDIEVNSSLSTSESIAALNNASVEGIQAVNYVCLPEGTPNAMSSVAAADYRVRIKDDYKPEGYGDISTLSEKFNEFLAKDSIVVLKASKKSEREVDLKPLIYDAFVDDDGSFIMKLSTGDFVVQIKSCCHFHIGKLGSHGFHGKANKVCTDGNATQQRSFLFLLWFLCLHGNA